MILSIVEDEETILTINDQDANILVKENASLLSRARALCSTAKHEIGLHLNPTHIPSTESVMDEG